MPSQIKRFGKLPGIGTPTEKPIMKKSNRDSKGPDSPKPVRAAAQATEKEKTQTATPINISRERIMAGASTTTEVLSEILQHHKRAESVRHWGINE